MKRKLVLVRRGPPANELRNPAVAVAYLLRAAAISNEAARRAARRVVEVLREG